MNLLNSAAHHLNGSQGGSGLRGRAQGLAAFLRRRGTGWGFPLLCHGAGRLGVRGGDGWAGVEARGCPGAAGGPVLSAVSLVDFRAALVKGTWQVGSGCVMSLRRKGGASGSPGAGAFWGARCAYKVAPCTWGVDPTPICQAKGKQQAEGILLFSGPSLALLPLSMGSSSFLTAAPAGLSPTLGATGSLPAFLY